MAGSLGTNDAAAVLRIDEKTLAYFDRYDEKLAKIEAHSKQTADIMIASFKAMKDGSSPLLKALVEIRDKIAAIGTAGGTVNSASAGLNNVGTSAESAAKKVKQAGDSITDVARRIDANKNSGGDALAKSVAQYNAISQQIAVIEAKQKSLNQTARSYEIIMESINKGKGGVLQPGQAEAGKAAREEYNANLQVIAALRQKQQEIVSANVAYQKQMQMARELRTYEQERTSLPNQRSQNTLAEMRKYYTELEKSSAKAAAQAERDAKKREAAEMRAYEQAQRAAERAAAAQERASARAAAQAQRAAEQAAMAGLRTPTGALNYSKNARTYMEEAQAVKYLQAAKMSLSKSDADVRQQMAQLNAAIDRHKNSLREAGLESSKLASRQRNLMDTAGQLQRQIALLFSVSQIEAYIGKIAQVRGMFELQQRSLEAILQNKTEADQIFQKTVDLAIKSPFQIKELISYTKQLAAYRIEGDKLYDTTKRLADVSAGLGVDMQRLILAYGQVKAAAYLRGTEVRQFTEAGVNMYGELKRYFQEVKGESYTTAQIVDMISKRMVTFQDVEAVFQRLTDKGGLFYNMQAIQSETLNGKIANLKDSLDVMFNEIGKANEGIFKGTVDGTKTILDNWQSVANAIKALIAVLALLKVYSLQTGFSMKAVFSKNFAVEAQKTATSLSMVSAGFKRAGTAATIFGQNLKAAFMNNIVSIAIIAAISALYNFISWLDNYKEKINEINQANGELMQRLVDVENAFQDAGSAKDPFAEKKKQIEALRDELEQQGIKIHINIEDITPEQIDKVFGQLRDAELSYMKMKKSMDLSFAENNNRPELWGLLGNNIDTDVNDLQSSYEKVINQTNNVDKAVNTLYNSYASLTKEQQAALDAANKRGEGQSEMDYLVQRANAVRKISGELKKQNNGFSSLAHTANNALNILREYDYAYGNILHTGGDFKTDLAEFDNELDDIEKRLKQKYTSEEWKKNRKIYLEAALNSTAAEKGWSEFTLKHAKEHLKIGVKIDKNQTAKEVEAIDKQIKDAIEGKRYSINLSVNTSGIKSAMSQALAGIKSAQEDAEIVARAKEGRWTGLVVDKADYNKVMGTTNEQMHWYGDQKTAYVTDKQWVAYKRRVAAMESRNYIELGGDPNDLSSGKSGGGRTPKANSPSKTERDIWNERISVLKEMQQEYENVRKYLSDKDAQETIKQAYKESLAYTKMPQNIIDTFIPTKEGLRDALKKLLADFPQTAQYYTKRMDLKKSIAKLQVEIDQERLQKSLDEAKEKVDSFTAGYDLFAKLRESGMNTFDIEKMFPNITVGFKQMRREIDDTYASLFPKGEYLQKGTEQYKAYQDAIKALDKKAQDYSRSQLEQLFKDYKQNLSERLQLDSWYYAERRKIQDNAELQKNPEMQRTMQRNLTEQYNSKSDELTWKEFKESDFYVDLFDNLEYTSTRAIRDMRVKLQELRGELNHLQPTELKNMMSQISSLDDKLRERNPFEYLVESIRKYRDAVADLHAVNADGSRGESVTPEQLEKLYKRQMAAEQKARQKASAAKTAQDELEADYNKAVDEGASKEQLEVQQMKLETQRRITDSAIAEALAQGKITKALAEQLRNLNNGKADKKKGILGVLDKVGQSFDSIQQTADSLNESWEQIFGGQSGAMKDALSSISEISGGMSATTNGIKAIMSGDILGGITQTLTGVMKTFAAFFAIGDKKKERQIKNIKENIEKLKEAYEELKQSMDEAFDITNLQNYHKQAVQNLKDTIKSYEATLKLEKSKKKKDKDAIKEYESSIKEMQKTLKEMEEGYLEQLGGFGSQSNYQSAAQAFADAWVDAFNQGEDALDALNDKWDEYVLNLVKKQAMLRVVGKMLQPLLKAVDDAVSEGSEEDEKLTRNELERIQTLAKKLFPEMSEQLKELMQTLNFTGTGASDNLDALKQGIEGVTEETAQALEALLNSIRFFVSAQQSDVAAIRAIMESKYGAVANLNSSQSNLQRTDELASGANNPMLAELRVQSAYLKSLSGNFENVMARSQSSKGAGLRVYIQ